jgi:CBS domain-containing protein
MQISEIMHQGVIVVQASDSVRHVAQIMRDEDVGALPVYDNESPTGFVTDRDIVLACADEDFDLDDKISEAMSPEFIAVSKDKDITEAARIMEEKQISRLLVVDGKKPVGIVSLSDLSANLENPHLKSEVLNEIKQ